MIKSITEKLSKLITIAYLHKSINFVHNSEAEKGGEA